MGPLGRLAAVLAALLLGIAQARIHTSLRGGNSTAVVDSDDVNLVNQEVDESLAGGSGLEIDADEDPESVYEATLADEQMKADLAAHGVQILDAPAHGEISSAPSVAMSPDTSSDVESVYEAIRKVGLEEVVATHKAVEKAAEAKIKTNAILAVGKPKEKTHVIAPAKPRANRIKQLIAAAARKAVKDVKKAVVVKDVKQAVVVKDIKKAVVAPVPKVNMQVRTKKASTVVEKPHLQKNDHAKADVKLNHRGLHNSAMDAAAKIVERGRKAASGLGDKDEVGIVADGEEAATTDDGSSDAGIVADGGEAAATDDGSSDAEDQAEDAQETHHDEAGTAVDAADEALEEGAEVDASEEADDGTDDDGAADEQIADGEAGEAQDDAEE